MSKPTIPAIILTAGLIIAPNAMAADTPTMRPLATATLDTLAITDVQADVPGYTQSSFTYWNKQPQIGRNATTADMIMMRDFTTYTDNEGDVTTGTLDNDPYTGASVNYKRGNTSSIDIEHVVARSEAWDSGASKWTAEQRRTFANDPLELIAVSSSSNRAHGERDAAGWLPGTGSGMAGKNAAYDCKYVARQIAVKAKYGLTVDRAEHDAMKTVLNTCPAQTIPLDSDGEYWADNTIDRTAENLIWKSLTTTVSGRQVSQFNPDQPGTITLNPALYPSLDDIRITGLPQGWVSRTDGTTIHVTAPSGDHRQWTFALADATGYSIADLNGIRPILKDGTKIDGFDPNGDHIAAGQTAFDSFANLPQGWTVNVKMVGTAAFHDSDLGLTVTPEGGNERITVTSPDGTFSTTYTHAFTPLYGMRAAIDGVDVTGTTAATVSQDVLNNLDGNTTFTGLPDGYTTRTSLTGHNATLLVLHGDAVVWMRRITLTAKQSENKTATADTTAPTPLAATGATVATAAVIALILAAAALALYRFRR